MNRLPHLLILTSKTGGGHVSLAESLADLLADDFTGSVVDPQPGWIHRHYQLVSRHALWLWSAEFRLTDTPFRAQVAHRLFSRLMGPRLARLIQRENPTAILSTYPFFSYAVQQTLRSLGRWTPLVLLYSDPYSLHWAWLTVKDATLNLAPSREAHEQALAAGVMAANTQLIGWPTRRQFYAPDPEAAARCRETAGLAPERLTVFLQGGGEGSAGFAATVERILALTAPNGSAAVQLILAVGTNERLQRQFQNRPGCYVLPFTKSIAPWMACADLVMGKAGPNMLFEATTLGKPFVATTFIPGQEEGNLEMIRRYGLGWVALSASEQIGLLQRLVQSTQELAAMRESVEGYRRWNREGTAKVAPLMQDVLSRLPLG